MDDSVLAFLGEAAKLYAGVSLATMFSGTIFTRIRPGRSDAAQYAVLLTAALVWSFVFAGAAASVFTVQLVCQLVIVAGLAVATAAGLYGQAVSAATLHAEESGQVVRAAVGSIGVTRTGQALVEKDPLRRDRGAL